MSATLGSTTKDARAFSDETLPASLHPLHAEQKQRLFTLLQKPVHIKSKDGSIQVTPSAACVIDCFVHGYLQLSYSLNSAALRDYHLHDIYKKRPHISHICSIRGSTTTSLLQNGSLNDDLDVVIKLSSPPPLLKELKYFRTFCLMLGAHVFEKMITGHSSVMYTAHDFMTCSSDALHIIDKTTGIFKGFFPFPDQSKCIFAFNGLKDAGGMNTGINLDLTIVFRPDQTMRVFRPISPASTDSSLSSLSEEEQYCEPSWHANGSQSFAHDAVEIILPVKAQQIDFTSQAHFRPLFGLDMDYLLNILQKRSLVVLDAKMHLGYRRLFYEISKGKIPLMTNEADWQELKKISSMLFIIEENPISKIKPGLELLQQFTRDKAENKEFALHLFLNGYTTIKMVNEALTLENKLTQKELQSQAKISSLLHTFEREFIHDTWQSLFPDFAQKISSIENPINIMANVEEIKAHLKNFVENQVRLSLGCLVRVAGVCDKEKGFILSRALSIEEVCFKLKELKETLPADLFDELRCDLLEGGIEQIKGEPQAKWIFLYILRRIQQKLLTVSEVKGFSPHLHTFLQTWIENETILSQLPLPELLFSFAEKWAGELFTTKEDLSIAMQLLRFCQKHMHSSPRLLAPILYYALCINRRLPFDESLLEEALSATRLGGGALEVLLDILPADTANPHLAKQLFPYLPSLLKHANQKLQKKVFNIAKTVLHSVDIETWSCADKQAFYLVLKGLCDKTVDRHLFELIFRLKKHILLNPLELLEKKPALLLNIQEDTRSELIFSLLESQNAKTLDAVSAHFTSDILNHCVRSPHLQPSHFMFLFSHPSILNSLIKDARWLYTLSMRDEKLSIEVYAHLSSLLSKEGLLEITIGLKSFGKRSILPFIVSLDKECFAYILRSQPHCVLDAKEDVFHQLASHELLRLAEHLLSIQYTWEKHRGFFPFYLCLTNSFVDKDLKQNPLFYALVDTFIPSLSRWNREGGVKNHHLYSACIQKIIATYPEQMMPPSTQAIIKEALCFFDARRISTTEYIKWATEQQKTAGIIDLIFEKIRTMGMSEGDFLRLADVFSDDYKTLFRLIQEGKKHDIQRERLDIILERVVTEKKRSEEVLSLIDDLYHSGFSAYWIQKAIATIPSKEHISLEAAKNACALFTTFLTTEPSLCSTLAEKLILCVGLDKDRAYLALVCDYILSLLDQSADPRSYSQLSTLIHKTEANKEFFSQHLFTDLERSERFIQHLHQSPFDGYYVDLLSFTLSSITEGMGRENANIRLFPLLEREIIKVHAQITTESSSLSKKELQKLRSCLKQFLLRFFTILCKEQPSLLQCTWLAFQNRDIYSFLSSIAPHVSLSPPLFLHDIFSHLSKTNLQPQTLEEKESLQPCLKALLDSSDDLCCFTSFAYHKKFYPDDPLWPSYLPRLLEKSLEAKDESMILWISRHTPADVALKSWKKCKLAIAEMIKRALVEKNTPAPIQIRCSLASFHNKIPLDLSKLYADLICMLCDSPYSDSSMLSIQHLLHATVGVDTAPVFTRKEEKQVEKSLSSFLNQAPFSCLRDNYIFLSKPQFSTFLNEGMKQLMKKYALDFFNMMCAKPVSEELYGESKICSIYLMPLPSFEGPIKRKLISLLQDRIDTIIAHPQNTLIQTQCLTALLGIYCNIQDKEPMKGGDFNKLCYRALPLIEQQSTLCIDVQFIISYTRILIILSDSALMRSFIEKFCKQIVSQPVDADVKLILNLILIKTIIPASFQMLSENSPYNLLCDALISLNQPKSFKQEEVAMLCNFLHKYVEQIEHRSTHSHISEDSKRIEKLLSILTPSLDFQMPLNSYLLFFDALYVLSRLPHIGKDLFSQIYLSCHTVIVGLKIHPIAIRAVDEIVKLRSHHVTELTEVKGGVLDDLFQIYGCMIPMICTNLQKVQQTGYEGSLPYNKQLQQTIYQETRDFLFRVNEQFNDTAFEINIHSQLYPIFLKSQAVKPFLSLFHHFYEHAAELKDPHLCFKYSQIFMGLVYFLQDIPSSLMDPGDPAFIDHKEFFQEEKNLASSHLSRCLITISQTASSLNNQALKDCLRLSCLRSILAAYTNVESINELTENLLRKELQKREKNVISIGDIFSHLFTMHITATTQDEEEKKIKEHAMRLWVLPQIPQRIKKELSEKFSKEMIDFLETPYSVIEEEDKDPTTQLAMHVDEKTEMMEQEQGLSVFFKSLLSSIFSPKETLDVD